MANQPGLQWLTEQGKQDANEPSRTLQELIDKITSANLRFTNRLSPRLLDQLRACQQGGVRRIICSLLDGDPDLQLNGVLGLREPERIVRGITFLMKLSGIARAWMIIDTALPSEWTRQLTKLAATERIRCIFVRNDYPQSDPTLLLYTILGRRLRPGMLPTERKVLLLDGAAAWRLGGGDGAGCTPLAVRDLVGNSSQYAIVPLGMRLDDVIKAMGIVFGDRLIRVSDPLRDVRVKGDLLIDGSEVAVHLMRPERAANPDPCIRCGWCVEGCPVRIQPAGLLEAAQRRDAKLAEHFGLHACIECGICEYVCPSRLPLLDAIRSLR